MLKGGGRLALLMMMVIMMSRSKKWCEGALGQLSNHKRAVLAWWPDKFGDSLYGSSTVSQYGSLIC
jgi:hypothetical protein